MWKRYLPAISQLWICPACIALVALATLLGCGGDPFAYVPSSGTVTYDDGSAIPAPRIKLVFVPIDPPSSGDEKIAAPNGKADVENLKEGSFSAVSSHRPGDGLLPGKHKVLIVAADERGHPIDGFIPPEYGDPKTTPVTIDTAEQPLKIKVRKPAGGVKAAPGSAR